MQKHVPAAGLIMAAATRGDAANDRDERWSPPAATLFIVSTSLALWAGIFLVGRLIFA